MQPTISDPPLSVPAAGREYTISPMSRRDLDAVCRIEALSFPTPWPKSLFIEELENPLSHLYTARIGERGEVVGYIIFWTIVDEAHILNVAVHPDYRGRGIGRGLVSFVVDRCRRLGLRRVFLEVRRSNIVARRLYRDLGFEVIGVRKGYYSDTKEDAIVMALRLARE